MKILLAGDSQRGIAQLRNYIQDERFDITTYVIGKDLIKSKDELWQAASSIDMIIVYIDSLCVKDVIDQLQQAYSHVIFKEIVLVIVTESSEALEENVLYMFSAVDHIKLPASKEEFLSRIRIHQQYKEHIAKNTYLVTKTLEVVANAIAITDTDGHLIWVNSAFTKLTGYEKQEAIGQHTRLLKSGKQSPDQYKIMWDELTAGRVWHGVLINKRKDGREYYEEMTITPLLDEHGKNSYYIAIKQDVTERILREKQLLSDVSLARQVQKGALSRLVDNDRIKMQGLYLSSEELSGDMYAWYEIDDSKYGILMYDVMGHGLSAALVTMSIRSLLRGIITKLYTPEQVIDELNHHVYNLFEDNESFSGFYCTALYVLVDLQKQEIQYINAGHPPAVMIAGQQILSLDKGCLPCGIFKELQMEKGVIPYAGPVKLGLYTDGLLEAIGHSMEDSMHTLQHILYEHRDCNNTETIEMLNTLLKEKRVNDDICFISVCIPDKQ